MPLPRRCRDAEHRTLSQEGRGPLLYELRSYWIDASLVDEYLQWVNDRALPCLVGEHGFRLIGFWRVSDTTGMIEEDPPNVVWMIGWQDHQECERGWTAARASDTWKRITSGIPKYHRQPANVRFMAPINRYTLQ